MKGKKNPETFGGKWRYLFMILALVFSVGVSAQKTVVKGNILDRDNLPVIGANILEKGTTNGTISDVDGNFTITVSSPKAVLLIKYIGYKDVEKAVSPMMKIVMEEDSEMLEDVVVIGYGSVKKSLIFIIGRKEAFSKGDLRQKLPRMTRFCVDRLSA